MMEKLGIAADHAGFERKKWIIHHLPKDLYDLTDFGVHTEDSVDYPDVADKLTCALLKGHISKGILICGTGIGISIRANRVPGIRCALCYIPEAAALARQHNDANILALGSRLMPLYQTIEVVRTFLNTPFEGDDRHQRRNKKLDILYKENNHDL